MPFKIAQTPTYKVKVTVLIPNESGSNTSSDFNVTFKRYTVAELEGDNPADEVSRNQSLRGLIQADLLRKAVVGWDGIEADDGEKIEFSAENLEKLISVPQALKAMSEAFWLTQYSAKQKN